MAAMPRLRCAIYTRKSSEEGLEQDFNSLHAQREACEAYIRSQKHEGWVLIPNAYDDGGLSGGTMNRPGLQHLLSDIGTGLIDVVVVYKVDRLTRSLADFARMVERFDEAQVSFVSVTQAFNTTSSMGRLTLNVLLSFAQFEREVTAERIRDKIKASKAKGIFMGGSVPLGYEVKARKLLIEPHDGKLVQDIYRLYLKLGTVRLLRDHLKDNTIKRRHNDHAWSAGMLYAMLRNPVYIGKIVHKETQYQGQHEALIEQCLWDKVQAQLLANKQGKQIRHRVTNLSPLMNKLYDPQGDVMVPTHSQKKGRRYRYYVSKPLTQGLANSAQGWRLSAPMIETCAIEAVKAILKTAKINPKVTDAKSHKNPSEPMALIHSQHLHLTKSMPQAAEQLSAAEIYEKLVHRIEVSSEALNITLNLTPLLPASDLNSEPYLARYIVPICLQRRHNELRFVLNAQTRTIHKDDTLIRNIARGHVWFEEWRSGQVANLKDIAAREGLGREYVADVVNLAFLSPQMVQAIFSGDQPNELNSRMLLSKDAVPLRWQEQERLWLKA